MPSCRGCGDTTLLPEFCSDCQKNAPAEVEEPVAVDIPVLPVAPPGRYANWAAAEPDPNRPLDGPVPTPGEIQVPVAKAQPLPLPSLDLPADGVQPVGAPTSVQSADSAAAVGGYGPPTTPTPGYGQPVGGYGASPYQSRQGPDPANMWLRVLAVLLDGFIVFALFLLILLPLATSNSPTAFVVGMLAAFVVATAYTIVPTALSGKTLGKMICGIKVIREGDPYGVPGWGPSIVRYIVNAVLSLVPASLGTLGNLIAAAVDDPEHRALHDRAASTRVVSTRAHTSGAVVAVIVVAALFLGVVVIGILSAIAIPVFLNQREKGVEVQMRADAVRAFETVVNESDKGTLKAEQFPLTIPEGTSTTIGTVAFTPAPGDALTISMTPNQPGAICVKVTNDEGVNPTMFLNTTTGTFDPTPCDGSTAVPSPTSV